MVHHLNTKCKQFMVGNGILVLPFCRSYFLHLYELTPVNGKPGRTTLY